MHSIIFSPFSFFSYTQQTNFWYRKLAISLQRRNANSPNLQEIPRTHSRTKWRKIVSKFWRGGRGETSPKNKINIENWILLFWSLLFTFGLNIIKIIAKHLQPVSHFGHLNKIKQFPKIVMQYMHNNFITDQFNRTKLTGCALEKIQHELAK